MDDSINVNIYVFSLFGYVEQKTLSTFICPVSAENPAITIHLNGKIKEALDAVKGGRSYAQIMAEILANTSNIDKEIQRLLVTEYVIS